MVGNSSPSRAAGIIEFILEIDMQDSPIVHISSLFAKLWAIWMDYPLLGSRVIIFSLLKPTQFRIFYYITSAVISRSSFNVVIFYCLETFLPSVGKFHSNSSTVKQINVSLLQLFWGHLLVNPFVHIALVHHLHIFCMFKGSPRISTPNLL